MLSMSSRARGSLLYVAAAIYVSRFVVVAIEYRARATHGPLDLNSTSIGDALPIARTLALVGLVLAVFVAVGGRRASRVVALILGVLAALAVVLVAWGPASVGIGMVTASSSPWDTSGFLATLVLDAVLALGFGALATFGHTLDR